jgi:hypothetical protein
MVTVQTPIPESILHDAGYRASQTENLTRVRCVSIQQERRIYTDSILAVMPDRSMCRVRISHSYTNFGRVTRSPEVEYLIVRYGSGAGCAFLVEGDSLVVETPAETQPIRPKGRLAGIVSLSPAEVSGLVR